MRTSIFLLIIAIFYILVAWLIFIGAKWCAAFFSGKEIDQVAMAFLAVVIVAGVVMAKMFDQDR